MSGPNDSGEGSTPTGDFTLPIFKTGPQPPSERFRLKMFFDTPRLEWRPMTVTPAAPQEPEFLKLDDPLAALANYRRYLQGGGLQSDLSAARFDLLDKAFMQAPTDPPKLPTFAEMRAWQDEAFYKRLGRPPPLFGAPVPAMLVSPPLIGPPPPSPFYKIPDPATLRGEPPAPKKGTAGDVAKAFLALPEIKRNYDRLTDYGMAQVDLLGREWDKSPWLTGRIPALIVLAPLPVEVVAGILKSDEARNFAFKSLRGVDVPVPFVRGLSFHVDDYGKADSYLTGAKPGDPQHPQFIQFGLKLDVLKAFPGFAGNF